MGSGCGDPIVERKFLRPLGNSPSQWHLTRGLLLCSQPMIHDLWGKVKRGREKFVNFSLAGRKAFPYGEGGTAKP